MKRVSFIPGFEGFSGILAGRAGKLVYPSNDNKAFDAPNGRQYARNYGSRIVLAQRAKDGAAFFMCKTKSATNISAQSKTNMAVLGSIQAILTAVKNMSTLYAAMRRVYNGHIAKADGVADGLTFEQYVNNGLYDMLKAKRAVWTDSVFLPGPPAKTETFTMTSPYYLNSGENPVTIKQSVWNKFFPYLATDSDRRQDVLGSIKIDGTELYVPFTGASGTTMPQWAVLGPAGSYLASNYMTYLTDKGLTIDEDHDYPLFNAMRIYKPTSQTADEGSDVIDAGTSYTTIRPES